MSSEDRLAQLEDRVAIAELKARYFRGVDTHDWELFRSVFTDDATFTGRGFTTAGGDAIVERVRSYLDGGFSSHHGHMPELTFTGPDSARGIWSMEDYVGRPTGEIFRGYGHYHETYRRAPGGWLISSSELTRLRFEWLPAEDPATFAPD
jgi:uncharacterized protein (TIGR02246 family)